MKITLQLLFEDKSFAVINLLLDGYRELVFLVTWFSSSGIQQ